MTNQEDLKEFRQEGTELLEAAEKALLSLEGGAQYQTAYNAIFRAFHNLKGAAGMMELLDLQSHTHVLETHLTSLKDLTSLTQEQIEYFLKGIDTARRILMGETVEALATLPTATSAPTAPQHTVPAATATVSAPVASPPVSAKKSEAGAMTPLLPSRVLLFSHENDLASLAEELKSAGFEVTHPSNGLEALDYLEDHKPHVIFISPAHPQIEDLKVIAHRAQNNQIVFDFDFKQMPVQWIVNYVNKHYENINLRKLSENGADLLKYQYADLIEFLKSTQKEHLEKDLSESMRSFMSFKSALAQKFK